MFYVDSKTAEIRTFHFQLDLSLQILSRLAHDETDDGARRARTAVALACAVPASRMARVARTNQRPALEPGIHAEDTQEDARRRKCLEVVRWKRCRRKVCRGQDGERGVRAEERGRGLCRVVGYCAVSAPWEGLLVGVAEVDYKVC